MTPMVELLGGMVLATAGAHFLFGWLFWRSSGLNIDYFGFMDLASPNRWSSNTPPQLQTLFRHPSVTRARNVVRGLMLVMFVAITVVLVT